MQTNREGLWVNKNYMAPFDYIIDSQIVEYDISKANISVLLDSGKISQSFYDELYHMNKLDREIIIGNYQRDHGLSEALNEGIQKARHSLFDILHLDQTNVLAINNDAIFVIKTGILDFPPEVQVSPHVIFRLKGNYRSFYKIVNKQYYYSFDPITNMEGMDIKGLGDYAISLHKQYMINWLMTVFWEALNRGSLNALYECNRFYGEYITKKLPLPYYRRLDSRAEYDLSPSFSQWARFSADFLTEGAAEDSIDISYNAGIIQTLSKIYLTETLRQTNKR